MKTPGRSTLLACIVLINVLGIFLLLCFVLRTDVYFVNDQRAIQNVFMWNNLTNDVALARKFSVRQSTRPYKFQTFDESQPEVFRLNDVEMNYFTKLRGIECFTKGTDWSATEEENSLTASKALDKCICARDWFGVDCGIPGIVWRSLKQSGQAINAIQRRKTPRRIIQGSIVNHEFDMMEIRLHEMHQAVDVFFFCESNYTLFGDPRPLITLNKLRGGFLKEFQHKIVYVYLNRFPAEGREDGWLAVHNQMRFLGQQGMKQIKGVRSDDIYIFLDADEIINKQVLFFLKLYDGFKDPIAFALTWFVFGYFWRVPDKVTTITAASSLSTFTNAMANDAALLRGGKIHPSLKDSFVAAGGSLLKWDIGDEDEQTGWHCSWCMEPEGIRWKLDSAINADKPRWGDFPEKKNLTYIKHLIGTGTWFDDESTFQRLSPQQMLQHLPRYVIEQQSKFRNLLLNQYYENRSLLNQTIAELKKIFGIS